MINILGVRVPDDMEEARNACGLELYGPQTQESVWNLQVLAMELGVALKYVNNQLQIAEMVIEDLKKRK